MVTNLLRLKHSGVAACSAENLTAMAGRAKFLKGQITSLEELLKEFEAGNEKAKIRAGWGAVAEILKGTSEAFVDLGSSLFGFDSPWLKTLKKARPLATSIGEFTSGGSGKNVLVAAIDMTKGQGKNKVEQCLSEFSAGTAKVMVEALANDKKGVMKAAGEAVRGSNCAAAWSIIRSSDAEATGEKNLGKSTNQQVKNLVAAASTLEKYNKDLEAAMDGYFKAQDDARDRSESSGSVKRLIKNYINELNKIDAMMVQCLPKTQRT